MGIGNFFEGVKDISETIAARVARVAMSGSKDMALRGATNLERRGFSRLEEVEEELHGDTIASGHHARGMTKALQVRRFPMPHSLRKIVAFSDEQALNYTGGITNNFAGTWQDGIVVPRSGGGLVEHYGEKIPTSVFIKRLVDSKAIATNTKDVLYILIHDFSETYYGRFPAGEYISRKLRRPIIAFQGSGGLSFNTFDVLNGRSNAIMSLKPPIRGPRRSSYVQSRAIPLHYGESTNV